jgi:hypothetical protein
MILVLNLVELLCCALCLQMLLEDHWQSDVQFLDRIEESRSGEATF